VPLGCSPSAPDRWIYCEAVVRDMVGVSCFGVYICIFKLCFMFSAENIVCCRLRPQDARCTQCTHRYFYKLVAATILQRFAFFFFFANFYVQEGAPTGRIAPGVPWARAGPGDNGILCYVRVTTVVVKTEQHILCFPHYLTDDKIFGKKFIEHKMCALAFCTTFSELFNIQRIIYICLHVKYCE
jgi:hypothetical protein